MQSNKNLTCAWRMKTENEKLTGLLEGDMQVATTVPP